VRIAEIYSSKQGEGFLTGTPSVFVRASGCNLRCWFCDTPFASWEPEGENLSPDEIVEKVVHCELSHIVITGGEPMLFDELVPLTTKLGDLGHHITIETAGTLHLPVRCDLMSISPKMANSTPTIQQAGDWHQRHERVRHSIATVERLIAEYEYQLKFVIGNQQDVDEALAYVDRLPQCDRTRVMLMPMGTVLEELRGVESWLIPLCQAQGVVFCPRRHIEWYGFARGT
jgi:7-carboxy-7-deazaguanine synthase